MASDPTTIVSNSSQRTGLNTSRLKLSIRAAKFVAKRLLNHLHWGRVQVEFPDGEKIDFQGKSGLDTSVSLKIDQSRAMYRLLRQGDLGFAESYIDGDWQTNDLLGLMRIALENEAMLDDKLAGNWLTQTLNRLIHWRNRNTKDGSKRNISYHYDLGNDFYRSWLDSSMSYSAALYRDASESMLQAQTNKYQRIAELAEISSNSKVLEIGCGWGGFMEHTARNQDCIVEGITLSQEQLGFANKRMKTARLDHRAAAHLTDYRDANGQYDAIVSIEMLEAVGVKHWPMYFQTLFNRLKPGGAAVVQVITIEHNRLQNYQKRPDFIQRHVFPGGMLPSRETLHHQSEMVGMQVDHEQTFGLSYARTLREWRQNFFKAWENIAAQGFDNRFKRLWEYYLCYCEAGFLQDRIDVGIYRFRKPL